MDEEEKGAPVREAGIWSSIMAAELDDDALHRALELE